jgi:hypothetical protein
MKKVMASALLILVFLLAGAYYYFSGKEYVVRLTEPEIQKKLEEKLPLTKTYLFVIQVTLSHPRIQLTDGSDRVRAGLDVEFNITVDKNRRPLGGTVEVTSGIYYDPDKGQFFLSDPVIDSLQVQGIPERYTAKVDKALTAALTEYYRKHPIYTLHIANLKQAAARMVLKDVRIKDNQLVVTLGI